MTGYRFNVGEVIAQELAAACQNDKGILTFPCIILALCRRAAVPTQPGDKYTVEKAGWSRKEYMRKMEIADATPIRIAMPTPPVSPSHSPDADPEEADPSALAEAQPSAPAATHSPPVASPQVFPVPSHTSTTSPTTSPTTTPSAMPTSRQSTPDSPLGFTPTIPSSPPPVQSEEAVPLHILQLRSQLQRIEAMQLHIQEEMKVFQQTLINFICFQFPSAATFFGQQSAAQPHAHHSAATQSIPSTNPSVPAGDTEEVHLSSDDENDIFDWQSPRDHPNPIGPTPQRVEAPESSTARHTKSLGPAEVPILSPAPTPAKSALADRTTPDSSAQRKGKAPAGRTVSKHTPSSPEEEE
ncbi:hypothetical protein V6N11_008929 [Hibiscus sabdariffa]|uniref:Uncharacterized protein n=1 Tax=Hibiscus sabdariffa TaxID=183260 RepID=A0ABR2PP49_9ROSI